MFYPRGRGRQWSWKGEKKSLPGRESFNCSFKREAGAAKARKESSVIGVSLFTSPQEKPRAAPTTISRGHVGVEWPSLEHHSVWSLAGHVGILGFPHAEGGGARGTWAQVPAVPCA